VQHSAGVRLVMSTDDIAEIKAALSTIDDKVDMILQGQGPNCRRHESEIKAIERRVWGIGVAVPAVVVGIVKGLEVLIAGGKP